jgi:hypothetical protein
MGGFAGFARLCGSFAGGFYGSFAGSFVEFFQMIRRAIILAIL